MENFIKSNPEMAFTAADIIQALNLEKGKTFMEDLITSMMVQASLTTLVNVGKIGSRVIRGIVFYSALE